MAQGLFDHVSAANADLCGGLCCLRTGNVCCLVYLYSTCVAYMPMIGRIRVYDLGRGMPESRALCCTASASLARLRRSAGSTRIVMAERSARCSITSASLTRHRRCAGSTCVVMSERRALRSSATASLTRFRCRARSGGVVVTCWSNIK